MASTKTSGTRNSKATIRKQGKAKSEPELITPDAWIDELKSQEVNDDDWSCSVVIIEETSPDASVFLEQFNEAATNGNRLAVKAISLTDVIEFVKKNFLKEHIKRATPLDLLCREIYNDAGPDFEKMIQTSLLAHLLKYIILEYKELNKHIRNNLANKNKEFEDYRQSLWPSSNIKTASAKSGKTGFKSELSGKSGLGQSKTKVFTNLRKRGEEWKDVIWIEDAPIDGPQLYVALSRFYDPSLPLELLNVQVPLDAVIELDSVSSISETVSLTSSTKKFSNYSNSKANRGLSVRDKLLLEKKKITICNFWNEINLLKSNLPTSLMFKNVMFLQLVPSHCEFQNEIEMFRGQIYRQISHFMYDIFENYKLHKVYLNALDIIDITDECIHETPNMQIYNSILDNIPHEALTIACVLDAMLVQVCSSEGNEQRAENKENELPFESTSLGSLLKYLQKMNRDYDMFQEQNNASEVNFDTSTRSPKHIYSPIKHVLNYSDVIKIKTFHLKEEIANFITSRTNHVLKCAWKDFWTKHFVQHDADNNLIKLCNVIIKSENKCDRDVLYFYVYILIVNCVLDSILMSCDFVPPQGTGRPTIFQTSNENIFLYKKSDLCEDCLQEIGSVISILDSFHNLNSKSVVSDSLETFSPESSSYSLTAEIIASNLFYIDDMPSDILLQNLQSDFTRFNRFETRFCPFTEQLVIVFHNLFCIGEMSEESFVGKLTTEVPPRDFIEYVVEEEFSWLNSYYNNNYKTPNQSLTSEGLSCLLENEPKSFVLFDSNFVSHRSLKYERLQKEQMAHKLSTKSSKSKDGSFPNTSNKSGSESDQNGFEVGRQDEAVVKEDSLDQTLKNTNFIGYKLGEPQRFQFTGLAKEKLFEDSTKIIVRKIQKLYGDESNSLNATINGHTLYYSYEPTSVSNIPFHVILSSGIILYFGLSSFEQNKMYKSSNNHKNESTLESLPEVNENHHIGSIISDTVDLKTSAEITGLVTSLGSNQDSVKFPHKVQTANFHEIPSIYDLKISTPSGLHVELIQHKDLMYVRQKLLSKGYKSKMVQQEEYRCYSSSGCIIKFMNGGEIEILGGNGALYSVYEIKENMNINNYNEDINITSKRGLEEKDKLSLVGKTAKSQKKKSSKASIKKQTSKDTGKKVSITDFEPLLNTLEQELKSDFRLKIVNYKYTTPEGRGYVVRDSTTARIEDVLMITSVDISNNCINSERLDGLTSTHSADGSLTVNFPDGSCITSIPIEAEEIFCEWSASELDLWFTSSVKDLSSTTTTLLSNTNSQSSWNTQKTVEESDPTFAKNGSFKSHKESLPLEINKSTILTKDSVGSLHSVQNISHKNSITSKEDGSIKSDKSGDEKIMRKNCKIIYSEDGFVVYTLNYLMEHPNYSSVYYDSGNREVEFKLPFLTSVSLKSDGTYRAYFEGVNLMVENNEVYLNRLSKNGDITRSVVINTKGPLHGSNNEVKTKRNIAECFDECAIKSLSIEMKKKLLHFYNMDSYILYSVNELGNQIFIDFDFNIYELVESKVWHGIKESDYCCFVINKDLSGFRLVGASEVDQHVQFVLKNHGLARKSDNIWSSLLTSLPVLQNESQKWYMERKETLIKSDVKSNVSTFGRRESWTKPFVRQETTESSLTECEEMLARILHRIPTQESIMSSLKLALEEFKTCSKSSNPTKISIDPTKGDLNLTEIINDPSILHNIYNEERGKAAKENDMSRNNMKNSFLWSLVRKACMKARKIRQNNSIENFKYILRTKNIPPYHLSCFSQVHNILDEVLETVNALRKTPSSFERVGSIIDEILNLAVTAGSSNDLENEVSRASETRLIREIISEIFGNFCDLSGAQSYQILINSILEKPLNLVKTEEIELLCQAFQTGSGDCPILYDEEFILHDVLEARHQLSHYFENLREMLQYYRDHVFPQDYLKNQSASFNEILNEKSPVQSENEILNEESSLQSENDSLNEKSSLQSESQSVSF